MFALQAAVGKVVLVVQTPGSLPSSAASTPAKKPEAAKPKMAMARNTGFSMTIDSSHSHGKCTVTDTSSHITV